MSESSDERQRREPRGYPSHSSLSSGHPTGLGHRLNPVHGILLGFLGITLPALEADDFPKETEILATMTKVVAYHHENLSVDGGYASSWDVESGMGYSEHREGVSLIS